VPTVSITEWKFHNFDIRCEKTNTEGPQKEKNCVFPFEYKNKVYDSCTNIGETDKTKFWCSTEVDSSGNHQVIFHLNYRYALTLMVSFMNRVSKANIMKWKAWKRTLKILPMHIDVRACVSLSIFPSVCPSVCPQYKVEELLLEWTHLNEIFGTNPTVYK
jgi:Fibronectin type II domain